MTSPIILDKHRHLISSFNNLKINPGFISKNLKIPNKIHKPHFQYKIQNKKHLLTAYFITYHQIKLNTLIKCQCDIFDKDAYFMPDGYDSDDYEDKESDNSKYINDEAFQKIKKETEMTSEEDDAKSKLWDKGQYLFETTSSALKDKWQVASDIQSKTVTAIKEKTNKILSDLPEGWFKMALWLWERPVIKVGRLTMFLTQLPALGTLLITQLTMLATHVSLPMLPPLLFGAGILLRSIWMNAGYIFPRLYITIVIMWIIWFLNSLVYKTLSYLKSRSTITERTADIIVNWTECLTLLISGIVILSMIGVNISAILLPLSICLAFAAKDLSHNFLAGFVLFLVQPFRIGDKVSVIPSSANSDVQWFEGICEKVDLRYTVLRRGLYKLHVPNYAFITKEFMVMDQEIATTTKEERTIMSDEVREREKEYNRKRDEEKNLVYKEYLRHKSGDDGQLWGRLPHSHALRQQEMFKNQNIKIMDNGNKNEKPILKNKSKKRNQEIYYDDDDDKNLNQCNNIEINENKDDDESENQSNECILKSEREGNYVVLYYEGDTDEEI